MLKHTPAYYLPLLFINIIYQDSCAVVCVCVCVYVHTMHFRLYTALVQATQNMLDIGLLLL